MDAEDDDHERACEHDQVQAQRQAEQTGRFDADWLEYRIRLIRRVVDDEPNHEPASPPDPPPPVATKDMFSFTAARDFDTRNATVRGPPGGPRAGWTSMGLESDVRLPPESERTKSTV